MNAIEALIAERIDEARRLRPERPALIGVSGAQGSGKSFQCRAYASAHPRVAHFSLDDVYLSGAARDALARAIHPLFRTRGAPGTHDLALAERVIASLARAGATPLPRFDKRADEPLPERDWPAFDGPAEAILIDGWCLGAHAPPPSPPLNEVEHEDVDGRWRAAIDAALEGRYAAFFARFDAILHLQAPSFDIVRRWRAEQEAETLGRPLTAHEEAALARFVQHFERVTRAMLSGHHGAGWIVRLDEGRDVISIDRRA